MEMHFKQVFSPEEWHNLILKTYRYFFELWFPKIVLKITYHKIGWEIWNVIDRKKQNKIFPWSADKVGKVR